MTARTRALLWTVVSHASRGGVTEYGDQTCSDAFVKEDHRKIVTCLHN